MARFFLPPEKWEAGWLVLDEGESRHAAQVLRIRPGDSLGVLDGKGREARVSVVEVSPKRVAGSIEEILESPPPRRKLGLAVSMLKNEAWEWALEKATELGAWKVAPLVADRSVVRWNVSEGVKKLEKWNRRMIEACKQCGSRWLPELMLPKTVPQFLAELEKEGGTDWVGGVASLDSDALPIRSWINEGKSRDLNSPQPEMRWMSIGPEGDWSSEEARCWDQASWKKINLGDRVLRAETAVVAALAMMALS